MGPSGSGKPIYSQLQSMRCSLQDCMLHAVGLCEKCLVRCTTAVCEAGCTLCKCQGPDLQLAALLAFVEQVSNPPAWAWGCMAIKL